MTKADIGDVVRIKYGTHAGKLGTVVKLERRLLHRWDSRLPGYTDRTIITYLVRIDVGLRRFPSSHFNVVKRLPHHA